MSDQSLRKRTLRAVRSVGQRLRPDAHTKRPAERGVLDDIVMTRPWNIFVKVLRVRARLRRRSLKPGVTVVVVNWNTAEVTADVLRAVRWFSPPGTRVLLVDNGSRDGSRERFAAWPSVETIFLPANASHGAALDIGVLSVRTTVAVTLDSDAIPVRRGWLDLAVEPLEKGRALLAGVRSSRNFVHPVYLAIDTATFACRGLSFQIFKHRRSEGEDEIWGVNAWDTAELLMNGFSSEEVHFVEGAPAPVSGLRGGFVSDVVYHHGGVTLNNQGGISQGVVNEWRAACHALGLAEVIAEN